MKVTIVAGAPHQDRAFINKNIDRQSFVIAADAGHRILDFEPDLIVGDFDSSERPDCSCPVVTLNPVKNDSDTFDCVQRAVERGATQIEFFGALGGRIDHTLANIHALIYCAQQGIDAKIIDPGNVLYVGGTAYLNGEITGLTGSGHAIIAQLAEPAVLLIQRVEFIQCLSWGQTGALIIHVCLLFHTITAHPIVCHRNVKQKCKAKIG